MQGAGLSSLSWTTKITSTWVRVRSEGYHSPPIHVLTAGPPDETQQRAWTIIQLSYILYFVLQAKDKEGSYNFILPLPHHVPLCLSQTLKRHFHLTYTLIVCCKVLNLGAKLVKSTRNTVIQGGNNKTRNSSNVFEILRYWTVYYHLKKKKTRVEQGVFALLHHTPKYTWSKWDPISVSRQGQKSQREL